MTSYYGFVRAGSGTLLGGVISNESSRFATEQQAQAWLDCVTQANRDAGRDVAISRIFLSPRKPQIKEN